jgi:hypothetical protein
MRTNRNGVTETASIRIASNPEYPAEHERIFGSVKKPCGWCNDSGFEAPNEKCRRECPIPKESDTEGKNL